MRLTHRVVRSFPEFTPEIQAGIEACSDDAFGTSFGVRAEDVEERLVHGGVLHLLEGNGAIQAFASSVRGTPRQLLETVDEAPFPEVPESDTTGLFLADSAVRTALQGKGLHKVLTRFRLREAIQKRLPVVFVTTQNPRVAASISTVLGESAEIADVQAYAGPFDTGLTRMVTAEKPSSRSPEINSLFEKIDIQKGGALLLLFKLYYASKPSQVDGEG